MVTDTDIEKALENEFDGQDEFLLVQDILTLRDKNKLLKEGLFSIRRSTEIMEARRIAEQALKGE